MTLNYHKSAWNVFFPGTQERVRNSRGKRAISVRATEVLLYVESLILTIQVTIKAGFTAASFASKGSKSTLILTFVEQTGVSGLRLRRWLHCETSATMTGTVNRHESQLTIFIGTEEILKKYHICFYRLPRCVRPNGNSQSRHAALP